MTNPARYCRWLIPKGNEFRPSAAATVNLVQRLRKDLFLADPANLAGFRYAGPIDKLAAATGGFAVHTVDNEFGDDARARVLAGKESLPRDLTTDWLDDPDREELRLVWPVDRLGSAPSPLLYPLTLVPPSSDQGEPPRYALELHLCHDYVYPVAKGIGTIPTECSCGEELSFEWDPDELVPAFDDAGGIFWSCEACCHTFEAPGATATLVRPFDGASEVVRGGAAYRFALKFTSASYVENASLAFAPALVTLVENEFGRDFFQFGALLP
jgi:hypothetical protein